MNEEPLFYTWTPLIAGLLAVAFPNNVIRSETPDEHGEYPPKMILRTRENGKQDFAWGFRDSQVIRDWLTANYKNTDLPKVNEQMNKFVYGRLNSRRENGLNRTNQ